MKAKLLNTRTCKWAKSEDEFLKENYMTLIHQELADKLNRTKKAVLNRCSFLKLRKQPSEVSSSDMKIIRSWYESHTEIDLNVQELANILGFTRLTVTRKAALMGLTNKHRKRPSATKNLANARTSPNYFQRDEWSKSEIQIVKDWYSDRVGKAVNVSKLAHLLGRSKAGVTHQARRLGLTDKKRIIWGKDIPHPKGFSGKKISNTTRQALDKGMSKFWNLKSKEERSQFAAKQVQTKIDKYGTAAPVMLSTNAYSRTKSGKREDLDNRFFRSAWEANYARYLNFLVIQKQILKWEYEPQTFFFESIKRGTRSYTPDFKVFDFNGSHVWHEVKGWMDAKSKVKLKRFAKFYPDEKIIVIGAKEYKSLCEIQRLIPNWE